LTPKLNQAVPGQKGTEVIFRRVIAVLALAVGIGLSAETATAVAASPVSASAVGSSHATMQASDWWW
jgi:hypothetical protein